MLIANAEDRGICADRYEREHDREQQDVGDRMRAQKHCDQSDQPAAAHDPKQSNVQPRIELLGIEKIPGHQAKESEGDAASTDIPDLIQLIGSEKIRVGEAIILEKERKQSCTEQSIEHGKP